MEKHRITISINSKRISNLLSCLFLLLIFANIVVDFLWFKMGHPNVYGWVRMFYFDDENNIPTYFSAFILLISAALLKIIALFKKKKNEIYSSHWTLLSFIFLYLSIDESASIHELLIIPLRTKFHLSGIFYFSWVIVGIVVGLIFLIFYYKFLLSLPSNTKYRFILAGIFYVCGAIGMELIGGAYSSKNLITEISTHDLNYAVITSIEESLEIIGILIFIYALLNYIQDNISSGILKFNLKSED
jgi:MFS family permease